MRRVGRVQQASAAILEYLGLHVETHTHHAVNSRHDLTHTSP